MLDLSSQIMFGTIAISLLMAILVLPLGAFGYGTLLYYGIVHLAIAAALVFMMILNKQSQILQQQGYQMAILFTIVVSVISGIDLILMSTRKGVNQADFDL